MNIQTLLEGEFMIGELNYLSFYSSGFKLDKLSYSKKVSIKSTTKYKNKEEVITAVVAKLITSSFL